MKKFKNQDLLFEISSAVLVARVRCGFTQSKLAKKVGTRQPGIARLENPTKLPTLTLLNRVAEALDQNIIFGFEPKDPNDIRFQKLKDESLLINFGSPVIRPQNLSINLSDLTYSSVSSRYDKVLTA